MFTITNISQSTLSLDADSRLDDYKRPRVLHPGGSFIAEDVTEDVLFFRREGRLLVVPDVDDVVTTRTWRSNSTDLPTLSYRGRSIRVIDEDGRDWIWNGSTYEPVNGGGGGGSAPNATATIPGVLRLTGDLGGTYLTPTVPGLAGKQASIQMQDEGSNLGTAGTVTTVNFTGQVTASRAGNVVTVDVPVQVPADGSIGLAKLANLATKTYIGRTSAGTGVPETVGVATLKADLSLNNVDNTADTSKPVSVAQAAAIAAKHPNILFQDEGVALGTAGTVDTINFTGTGGTASRVGNVLTIDVSGGGGGSAPLSITGTLGVGNDLTATLSGAFATGFQWYRNGVAISGATDIRNNGTQSVYTIQAGDAGTVLSVRPVGYTPQAVTGTIPGGAVDTRPRTGLGAANAYLTPATLLAGMTPIPGSANDGRSGTFSLTTTTGNFGWIAVVASVTTGGLRVFDGVGFGGWNGAGLAGNNTGASPDPCESTITYNDGTTTWRLFRQDFINANPTPANYTIS